MSDCIFCKIIEGDIPSTKVYETEDVLAFRDIEPQAPTHIVIIPKKHYQSVLAVEDNADILSELLTAAKQIAAQEGLDENGFRLVINTGEEGGQTVDHLHLHLLGGRSMQWPPG